MAPELPLLVAVLLPLLLLLVPVVALVLPLLLEVPVGAGSISTAIRSKTA